MKPRTAPILTGLFCVGAVLIGSCSEGGADRTEQTERPPIQRQEEVTRTRLPKRLTCPADLGNCVSVRGRTLYVEEVDPDGDGDAHFALASEEGITLPGITVVDVRSDLRPDPLPGPGDYLSAVGPVYPGSYGQKQVEATAIRFRHRPKRRP